MNPWPVWVLKTGAVIGLVLFFCDLVMNTFLRVRGVIFAPPAGADFDHLALIVFGSMRDPGLCVLACGGLYVACDIALSLRRLVYSPDDPG